MTTITGYSVRLLLALLGVSVVLSAGAQAAEGSHPPTTPDSAYLELPDPLRSGLRDADFQGLSLAETGLEQVTSVSQLSDVKPTDWAFQALQSLVERYGCIVGYPDRTYRGNRALSRYEFAAGVNACMNRIEELIKAGLTEFATKEDLVALQKLQEEFAAELATLRGRVDALDVRTATLEKQQFSTTTKLVGEAIFVLADTFGDAARADEDRTETIFGDRVRLNFDTSFTGKDRLRTRLQARNLEPFRRGFTGTNMTRLSIDGNENNDVGIDELWYRFPVGENLQIQVDVTRLDFYDALVSTASPFQSAGSGALSRYGRFNPIYRSGEGGAGVTLAYKFNNALSLEAGYIGDLNSNDPAPKNGLFNGASSAIGQIRVIPSKSLEFSLAYVHSYYPGAEVNLTGSTGSSFAASPFGARPTTANTLGAQVQFRISPKFVIGGWYGISFADQRGSLNDATVQNGAIFAAFPDLGKKGSLGGILLGIPPKVTDNDVVAREDSDTSVHLEVFYRYRLNNNISITPGVFVLFNPEHNDANDTQIVGVLRTVFSF